MYGDVFVKLNAHVIKKLSDIHDKWMSQNHSMSEQDMSYVVNRLIDNENNKSIHNVKCKHETFDIGKKVDLNGHRNPNGRYHECRCYECGCIFLNSIEDPTKYITMNAEYPQSWKEKNWCNDCNMKNCQECMIRPTHYVLEE